MFLGLSHHSHNVTLIGPGPTNVFFVKLGESSNFGSILASISIHKVVREKINFFLDDCIPMHFNNSYRHHTRKGPIELLKH
jgi:hypothetical protein